MLLLAIFVSSRHHGITACKGRNFEESAPAMRSNVCPMFSSSILALEAAGGGGGGPPGGDGGDGGGEGGDGHGDGHGDESATGGGDAQALQRVVLSHCFTARFRP